jgi:hypothetical protein
LLASGQLAASSTREQTPRPETLQDHDDRDRLVAHQGKVSRLEGVAGQHTVTRVTVTSIDDAYAGPPASTTVDVHVGLISY